MTVAAYISPTKKRHPPQKRISYDDFPKEQLSDQQMDAFFAVEKWWQGAPQLKPFYLAGYAGTGKTTIARYFAAHLGNAVRYGAFTGKAALVMRSKGCKGAQTIHSMIYKVEGKGANVRFVLDYDSDVQKAELVIIDECSMVDAVLASDLCSLANAVLVLGDPAQLPPVKGAGAFTAQEPDFLLTEVHRQAKDSAVLRCATYVRQGGEVLLKHDQGYDDLTIASAEKLKTEEGLREIFEASDIILCGSNNMRSSLNHRIRALKGYPACVPVEGDRVICLKNKRADSLSNGGIWMVKSAEEHEGAFYKMLVVPEDSQGDDPTEVIVLKDFFTKGKEPLEAEVYKTRSDSFTFGYAITVHKSQGSQWDRVALVDESYTWAKHTAKDESLASRHLYTGITRAAKKLIILTPNK